MMNLGKIDDELLDQVVGGLEEEIICDPVNREPVDTDNIVAEYNCRKCGNTIIYPPGNTSFVCSNCGAEYSLKMTVGKKRKKRR